MYCPNNMPYIDPADGSNLVAASVRPKPAAATAQGGFQYSGRGIPFCAAIRPRPAALETYCRRHPRSRIVPLGNFPSLSTNYYIRKSELPLVQRKTWKSG